MDKKTLDRMRELAGVAPIAETEADQSRNNMYQINESLKAVKETCADDDELEEGAKPDFGDIDGDGDKEETVKKAADDADDVKNESQQMREWAKSVYETVKDLDETDCCDDDDETEELDESSEGRPYVAVHVKKGTTDVTATSSYGAAQAAAKKWRLKSTAGIDVHLADVTHVGETTENVIATEQQQMREWSNSVYQNYEDKGHIMDQPEGETVDLSLRRYLNAEPTKVQVSESHTPKSLTESYKTFKAKK
jgi:hypothetical protein